LAGVEHRAAIPLNSRPSGDQALLKENTDEKEYTRDRGTPSG
jgi:hypothetical protein